MDEAADPLAGREIILEWHDYGEIARVTAVDAETGVEAMASGPRAAPRADLERLAMRLLARRLFGEGQHRPDDPDDSRSGAPGRGRLV